MDFLGVVGPEMYHSDLNAKLLYSKREGIALLELIVA